MGRSRRRSIQSNQYLIPYLVYAKHTPKLVSSPYCKARLISRRPRFNTEHTPRCASRRCQQLSCVSPLFCFLRSTHTIVGYNIRSFAKKIFLTLNTFILPIASAVVFRLLLSLLLILKIKVAQQQPYNRSQPHCLLQPLRTLQPHSRSQPHM